MDANTLTALQASIAKWERNAEAKTPSQYLVDWRDCPLCLLFFHDDCKGCPVAAKTGEEECVGSPYGAAHRAWENWPTHGDSKGPAYAAHTAARAEVAFLKSLLPSPARIDTQGEA